MHSNQNIHEFEREMAFTTVGLQDDLEDFIETKVLADKKKTARNIETVLQVLKDVFTRINVHEPRFSNTFQSEKGRIKGLLVKSPDHLEVRIYLDQIELFNIIENSAPKGATFIDIRDERSKALSIWSEFLTAAGHLSSRKIRERFQVILSQTVNRTTWTNTTVQVTYDKQQPRLRINNSLVVDIYPSFHCVGFWPKIGRKTFVSTEKQFDGNENRLEFELISKETGSSQPYSTDRDAWYIDFSTMEDRILRQEGRDICFSITKTITNRCLRPTSTIFNALNIRTVFLYICERHPNNDSWKKEKRPDRINSFLVQLVACLQSRCLPHYHLSNVNLFNDKSSKAMKQALQEAWKLARELCMNERFFKKV